MGQCPLAGPHMGEPALRPQSESRGPACNHTRVLRLGWPSSTSTLGGDSLAQWGTISLLCPTAPADTQGACDRQEHQRDSTGHTGMSPWRCAFGPQGQRGSQGKTWKGSRVPQMPHLTPTPRPFHTAPLCQTDADWLQFSLNQTQVLVVSLLS